MTTIARPAAGNPGAYISISASLLTPSEACDVSLYVCDDDSQEMRLFRSREYPITKAMLDELAASGNRKLYVATEDYDRFQQYLRDNLTDTLQDESLPVVHRFQTLNVVVRDVLAGSFKKGDIEETTATTNELSQSLVELINREDTSARELCRVLYHDYYTFTHSANVAYYCVMLAKELGVTDEEQLCQISNGALLHDIGKLRIPEKILTKPAKLTDEEFDVIKEHPTTGFRSLCTREDFNFGQLMIVYQHHERLDGSGYPVGCSAKEIHPWARICTVADVFEALTSNRPYRPRLSHRDAFEIMDRGLGISFERETYECWKQLLNHRSPS